MKTYRFKKGDLARWCWHSGTHEDNYQVVEVISRDVFFDYKVQFLDGRTMLCFDNELLPASNSELN